MSQFNPFAKTGSSGGGGEDGRGIVSIIKTDTTGLIDTYTIYYTDGTTSTYTITNGADGPEGPQGLKGNTGEQGPQGIQGEIGPQGPTGISIINAQINTNGRLILTLSNSTTIDCGIVKGEDGTSIVILDDLDSTDELPTSGSNIGDCYLINGHLWVYTNSSDPEAVNGFVDAGNLQGPAGRGISTITLVNGELIITYTDYTSSNLGSIIGPKGDTGEQGPRGQKGDNGKSAYEIAVDEGYIGTESQWIASLKGEKGDKGDTGSTGPQGLQGPKGDTGEQGLQGIQGLKGDDGDSAYQIWLDAGNIGTEQDFLNSLKADKNEVEITTTSTTPTDPDVELWVNLGQKETVQLPEIDDSSTNSTVNTYSVKKINEELATKVDKVSGKGLSTNDFTNAYKAAVDAAAPQATTYTKGQVDAALAGKVDKVDGKGLSTEDFTAAEKSKLSGIATGAEVNVQANWTQTSSSADDFIKNKPALGAAASKGVDSTPTASSTNLVTSGGVATALAAKLNAADVDDALSSTSTNPVQNRVVKAPMVRLVDAGAKNLFDFEKWASSLTGATRGTIAVQGQSFTLTATGNDAFTTPQTGGFHVPVSPNTEYVVTVESTDSNGQLVLLENDAFSKYYTLDTGVGILQFKTSSSADRLSIRFGVPTSGNASTISNVMLCTAEDYAISPEFVPYVPSNRELYEMILALQNAQNGG